MTRLELITSDEYLQETVNTIILSRPTRENRKEMVEFLLKFRDELMNSGWIDVNDRLPELKTYYDKELETTVREVSVEVLVTDGVSTYSESYSEDLGFHKSTTHWRPYPSPHKSLKN